MMTVEEFQQKKARLVALYGEAPREASGKRAQALAILYAQSEWTQRELATQEGISQTRTFQQLVFGRFLLFLITQGNQLPHLNEKQFRPLWTSTDKTQTEAERPGGPPGDARSMALRLSAHAAPPEPVLARHCRHDGGQNRRGVPSVNRAGAGRVTTFPVLPRCFPGIWEAPHIFP